MPSQLPQEDQSNWRLSANANSQLSSNSQDFLVEDMARLNLERSKNSISRFPDTNGSTRPSDPDSQPPHSRSPSGTGRLASKPTPNSGSTSPTRGQSQSQVDSPLTQSYQGDQPSYPSLSNVQRGPNPQKSHGTSVQTNGRPYRGAPSGFPRSPQYRLPHQLQLGIPQITSPTGMGYPANPSGHMSLGTPQQLFDMMALPVDPALSRVQQQNNLRVNHQLSNADPTNVHDTGNLPPMNNNMQSFNASMFPPQMPGALSMYPNQFYPSQDAYRADLAAQAQAMLAARLQQQYPSQYSATSPATGTTDQSLVSPSSSNGGQGPSANNRKLGLYKTELCRSWEEKHTCRYGAKCQFAHGEEELRNVSRHPKYKTEICRTFWVSGSCPYGKRCCFIHTELPHGTAPPNGAANPSIEGSSPPSDGRPRSQSNSSDPNEAPKSLLTRISTGGGGGSSSGSNSATPTPIDTSSTANFPFAARPPTGSLRLDTKSLDAQSYKTQNKSAFPVFTNSHTVQPAPEPVTAKSPIPVTAGPDFGRHAASRMEIVGPNTRNGPTTPTNGKHTYSNSTEEGAANHHRASSGSAWGQNVRGANANANTNYAASPVAENISSPWTTQELVTSGSRKRPW